MIFSKTLPPLLLLLLILLSSCPDSGSIVPVWFDYLIIENNTAEPITMIKGDGRSTIFFSHYLPDEEIFRVEAKEKEVLVLPRSRGEEIVFYFAAENDTFKGWITSQSSEQVGKKEKFPLDDLADTVWEKYIPKYKKWNDFVDFSENTAAQIYNFGRWELNDYYCYSAGCLYAGGERTSIITTIKSRRLFRKLTLSKNGEYALSSSSASAWLEVFDKSQYPNINHPVSPGFYNTADDIKKIKS